MKQKNYWIVGTALIFVVLAGCTGSEAPEETGQTTVKQIEFYDVQTQTPEFISYYESIKLTPEQEKIKEEALMPVPAPCCSDYSALTCCCSCNFAKSVWGLSNYLIVEHNYDAQQLREAVVRWIEFTHSGGWAGDACFEGRCNYPFDEDGCGGMGVLVLGNG